MCRYLNLIEYWANVINDTNNFSEECRRLAFSVLLCYPLKPAMVGHHQITCTHQNEVLLEKLCSINRIFFSKCVSKQPFNKITVWDDNAEFMSSLRSQGTCITECKLVAIWKLPTSFTPIFSASGVGDEENIYRPLKSPEKIRMLLVTLPFFFTCASSVNWSSVCSCSQNNYLLLNLCSVLAVFLFNDLAIIFSYLKSFVQEKVLNYFYCAFQKKPKPQP